MSPPTKTSPASARAVEKTLRLYKSYTWDVMRTYLPVREPFEYLYDPVRRYPLTGGKGLRPALCIATCRAFGGTVADAASAAASIELLHSALLVHDDITDESSRRRGRPTLNNEFGAEYGVGIAMNAGDALAFLSALPLYPTFYRLGRRVLPLLAMFQETLTYALEGQAIELGWMRDNVDVTEDDYFMMTSKKTGWYTAVNPCRVGAHLATRGRVDPGRFLRFGYYFGNAFQLRDDLHNFQKGGGRNEDYGDDILEGKRTLMLIHFLRHAPVDERQALRQFLATPRHERKLHEAERFVDLMHERGSVTYGRAWLRALAERTVQEFELAFAPVPDSEDKRFLRGLVPYLLS